MDHQKAITMSKVTETFAAWKTVNDQIKAMEVAVQQHDPVRDASLPELESVLGDLQRQAQELLLAASHALLKIKTPRSGNGDSTWA